MSSGDIQWSGRAVRWLFWRAPKRAARYTWDSNLALASDLGRRWILFAVFGAYLWGLRWLAVHLVPPLRSVSAILLLLWFWHGLNLIRWTIHARAASARARAVQREQYQIMQELRADFREVITNRIPGGGHTVKGMLAQSDPEYEAQQRQAAEQADQVRTMLPPEDRNVPLGDRFEPLVRLPNWLRRRRP